MHDWNLVEAGIFHAFHHGWISAISDHFNKGHLPRDYYALPEQITGPFGPDVVALQSRERSRFHDFGSFETSDNANGKNETEGGTALATRPRTRFVAEAENGFYTRQKKSIVVRHATGDCVIPVIETTSIGKPLPLMPLFLEPDGCVMVP
ncbi:MAG: hypothetical protein FJ267_18295, partial [Planctomycetes bacterium]|nr:hypothetical protein [Planctomycetota bacterium]